MKKGILPCPCKWLFLLPRKVQNDKIHSIISEKVLIVRIKIRNQNEKLLNGSEASVTTEKYLNPETSLDKVP